MTFDFIVVGAGSAGCVLARRLVEGGARVLLLEAGGHDRHLFVTAPAAFSRLFGTRFDWNLHTEPQTHLNGRRLYWPRGRVLGGSSAINATIWIRGARQDFDAWGPGWTWADVLPAFRSIETFDGGESVTRGGSGPLPVGARRYTHALSHAFVASAVRAGYGVQRGFNDGDLEGFGLFESNHRGGERVSAYRAFVAPILGHPGLTVRPDARVTRVLVEGGRAAGVELRVQGRTETLRAGGVILAAGAVHSPQLLMLSGVGPRAELARHGIDVRAHLPGVGENLQDHLAVPVIARSKVPSLDRELGPGALLPYLRGREGALASNVAEAGGFVRSRADLPAPDLQFLFGPAYFRDHGRVRARGDHLSLGPVLVEPRSRGRLTLRPGDPWGAPLIDPAYLTDERDLDALAYGVAAAREILRASPLRELRGEEVLPAHARVDEHIRAEAQTLYHPVGTCRLGDDDLAVVSRDLRVRGVDDLWVADASVMPVITRANTNAPSMMIGERAAALILG
ncbi:GMC family oxidoreductase [Deinococcus pimensis]|uniref:GMC family oxidoreductase n=1 Tax=Deinococcus pimensis TaxID=309888 RepID=UPI000485E7F6|nr:GMC family oxidoreductase N-terminal domain-containing protein [Deinococcus pimensis]